MGEPPFTQDTHQREDGWADQEATLPHTLGQNHPEGHPEFQNLPTSHGSENPVYRMQAALDRTPGMG